MAALLEMEPEVLAATLQCTDGQARAWQQYVVLCAVISHRKRRQIPFGREEQRARALLRCLPGSLRTLLADALRFAAQTGI
jgi:hypothetical protein